MRVLMWFVIGFAGACAVGAYLLSGPFLGLLALISIAAAVPLLFLKSPLFKTAGIILLGFALGSGWNWGYDTIYLQPVREYDGKTVTGTVLVSDYSYDTKLGVAADAKMSIHGHRYQVRVYHFGEPLSPGDRITGKFELRMTTANSVDGATYHQGKGIFLLVYADENVQVVKSETVPLNFFAAELRHKIIGLIDTAFPEDTAPFARALLLGDTSGLSYEVDTAFKIGGIRHIVAVSGLHISILFTLLVTLSGWRGWSLTLFGIPILVLFAAVAGFTPSVVRACIMQILVILAYTFKQEYDPPSALSFAVLVMLVINPLTITSVSFQLSVGCLVGIFLFYENLYNFLISKVKVANGGRWSARLFRWFLASVSITLSAMSVTTPLSALYFGTVSLVGVLTNLLTLWVVSFIFYGIMLVCLLGTFWPGGAAAVAFVLSWPIRYIQWIAKVLSSFSLSAVYTSSVYILAWLVLCYVLLAIFLLGRRKHPVFLAVCMCFGLVLAVATSWMEPYLSNYRFTVLDVGQGQCLLWQCGGRTYMVDCGGDNSETAADVAAQYLLAQGITHLDGLILTHYDEDHSGGVLPLMTRMGVDALYLPDIPDEYNVRKSLEDSYSKQIFFVTEPTGLRSKSMCISIFPSAKQNPGNESGLCILFQSGNCDILVTGDRDIAGEAELLDMASLPELEILVVGHHGSKYSTGLELLHATRPKTVVISVGEGNSYGHPTDEVLRRLKQFGCEIWRTDFDKTITFKG